MPFPPELRRAVDDEIASVDHAALRGAVAELSELYRRGRPPVAMNSAAERAGYLATRMPATFAANEMVFAEVAERVPAPIRSLLDVGAGPGTAVWAAAACLASLEAVTALERDSQLLDTGRRLARSSGHPAIRNARWIEVDARMRPDLPTHDLVVLSYSLGELDGATAVLDWAWDTAAAALVVVEPGTPGGFRTVLGARERLLEKGAVMAAPCPHVGECPLAARRDWCHFSARLERSSVHRRLKGGELGYEDEKFSYVAASKFPARPAEARIVRHPRKNSGFVQLTLCTPRGLQTPTITRSQKSIYRDARDARWGDAWPG